MNIPNIDPIKIAEEMGFQGIVFTIMGLIVGFQFVGPSFTIFGDIIMWLVIIGFGIPFTFVVANAAYYVSCELWKEAVRQYHNFLFKLKIWWKNRWGENLPANYRE